MFESRNEMPNLAADSGGLPRASHIDLYNNIHSGSIGIESIVSPVLQQTPVKPVCDECIKPLTNISDFSGKQFQLSQVDEDIFAPTNTNLLKAQEGLCAPIHKITLLMNKLDSIALLFHSKEEKSLLKSQMHLDLIERKQTDIIEELILHSLRSEKSIHQLHKTISDTRHQLLNGAYFMMIFLSVVIVAIILLNQAGVHDKSISTYN